MKRVESIRNVQAGARTLACIGMLALGGLMAGQAFAQNLGSWGARPNMPAARANGAVGIIGRNIYYAGGYANNNPVKTMFIYNLDSKTWKSGPDMPVPLHHIGQAAILDGKLYSIGGDNFGGNNSPKPGGAEHTGTSYNFMYDPETNKWTTLAPLLRTTATSAIIAFKKKIYVIGGVDTNGIVHTANQEYDPATNKWTMKKPMFTPRDHAGIDTLDSLIYVCSGGVLKKNTGAFEAYSPASDTWYRLPDLGHPRSDMGFGYVRGRFYAYGGEWPGIYDDNEEYDPVAKKWRNVLKMTEPWKAVGTAIVGDSMYTFGGYLSSGMTNRSIVWIPPNNPTDMITPKSLARAGRSGPSVRHGPVFRDNAIELTLGLDALGRLQAIPLRTLESGAAAPALPLHGSQAAP